MELWILVVIICVIGFLCIVNTMFKESRIYNEENTPLTKQQQIDLITGKSKGRVYSNLNSVWTNKQDIFYSSIKSRYELNLSFGQMKPNVDYNGMSATAHVISESQRAAVNIRKMCKEKYDLDIHYMMYGVEAEMYSWEQEEEFDDALEEVLDKE